MAFALLVAVALSFAGHLLRRATPALLGLRDRSLPFRWPWLEAVAAALGWVLGRAAGGWPPGQAFWPLLALTLLLLAACATDYLVQLIPDRISLGGGLLGIGLAAFFPQLIVNQPLHDLLLEAWGLGPDTSPALAGALLAGVGALTGFALLELVRRLAGLAAGIEAMGMGDSKLLLLIGAFLGPFGALATLALSFLLGVVHGALAVLLTRKPHAPFGPALAAGAWLYLFAGDRLAAAWDGFQALVLALPLPWLIAFYAVLLGCVVLLVLRVRLKAAEYEAIIEADYRAVDEQMGAEPEPADQKEEAAHE